MRKTFKILLYFAIHVLAYLVFMIVSVVHVMFFGDWEELEIDEKPKEELVQSEDPSAPDKNANPEEINEPILKVIEVKKETFLVENTLTNETRWMTKEEYLNEVQSSLSSTLFLETKLGKPITISSSKSYEKSHSSAPLFPFVPILLFSSFLYLSFKVIKSEK